MQGSRGHFNSVIVSAKSLSYYCSLSTQPHWYLCSPFFHHLGFSAVFSPPLKCLQFFFGGGGNQFGNGSVILCSATRINSPDLQSTGPLEFLLQVASPLGPCLCLGVTSSFAPGLALEQRPSNPQGRVHRSFSVHFELCWTALLSGLSANISAQETRAIWRAAHEYRCSCIHGHS